MSGGVLISSVGHALIHWDFSGCLIHVPDHLLKKYFQAYSIHQNGISKLNEFDILAKSDNSIHAIKHKSKNIYGIVFHPEVRNQWVIEKFIEVWIQILFFPKYLHFLVQ